MAIRAWLLLAVLLWPGSSIAAPPVVHVGHEPAWVMPVPVPAPLATPGNRQGPSYPLLLDFQQDVVTRPAESYLHTAVQVVNEQGVPGASQLTFEFDPLYEQLTVHRVVVHRDGRTIDKLVPSRIRVLQRETDLERSLYVGTWTALLVLDDVRPGDVVEYSYTIRGENPVLAGHFGTRWTLGWSAPTGRIVHRLLWPADRPLFERQQHTKLEPAVRKTTTTREYLWDESNPPLVQLEDGQPEWYDPFPRVQLSDFRDWGELARWGAALFRVPDAPGSALRERIELLKQASPSAEQRALAAIRFVQDEVRYLGIELGQGSHRPTPPERVLAQRFGDCKDKAMLLVALLRGLGFRAEPALVNSRLGVHVRDRLPAVDDFDHVIVRFAIDDTTRWVDATEQDQRGGTLDQLDAPDYGVALVLADSTRDLSPVSAPARARGHTRVVRDFDARRLDSPATLTVRSVYDGRDANAMRYTLRNAGEDRIERRYREAYAPVYPGIQTTLALVVHDDEAANRLTITEHYRIPDFWAVDSVGKKRIGRFDMIELRSPAPERWTGARIGPLHVGWLHHIRCETHALMPEGWSASPGEEAIEDSVVRFREVLGTRNHTLDIVQDLEVRLDAVSAADAEAARATLARVADDLEYATLPGHNKSTSRVPRGPNPIGIAVFLAALGMALVVARWFPRQPFAVHRSQADLEAPVEAPVPGEPPVDEPPIWGPVAGAETATGTHELAEPAGAEPATGSTADAAAPGAAMVPATVEPLAIGGWLVVLGINVSLSPLLRLYNARSLWRLLGRTHWSVMVRFTHMGTHPGFLPEVLFELANNVLLVVWMVGVAILFSRRRRTFPRAWFALTVYHLGYLLTDIALTAYSRVATEGMNQTNARALLSLLTGLAVWGAYLLRSKRVARTFVR